MSSGHEVMLGFQWIIGILGADTTLAGFAPGGVKRALAPPDTATPFVIVGYQAGSDVTTMNAFRVMSSLLFQVKASGPASGTVALANAAEQIDVLLDQKSGTTTGGYVLSCSRQSPLEVDELVTGELWTNIGGLYRLQIEQTS